MMAAALLLGLLPLAGLVGGMIFFATIMAPTIFTVLEPEPAGRLIRRVFPRYYLYIIVSAAVSALGFLAIDLWAAASLGVITAAGIWLRQGLMPAINQARDTSATARFDRLHRLSVWVNGAQLMAALAVLVRIALR